MTPNAFAVASGEGRPIDLGTFAMTEKASAESTGGLVSVLEATEPAGFGPPMHIHHDAAEFFPAAMTGYFDALSTAVARGEADEAALDAIARAHNMEIVGPVPETYL